METMVAAGVAAVVGAVLFGFMSSSFDIYTRIKNTTEIADTMSEIRAVLAVNRQCTNNFKGQALSNLAVTQIKQFDVRSTTPATPVNILTLGPLARKQVTVSSINLNSKYVLSSELIIADLTVQFNKTNSNELVAQRTIPIFAVMDKGLVKECWVKQDQSSLEYNQACMSFSGGALTYDPLTQNCGLNNGTWYFTTGLSISCPSGKTLPPYPNKDVHCHVTPPSTFDDKTYYPPTYLDWQNAPPAGTGLPQFQAGRPPWQLLLDVPTSTCSCGIAKDITIGGFQCGVYCVNK
jgi:hypothetical protein